MTPDPSWRATIRRSCVAIATSISLRESLSSTGRKMTPTPSDSSTPRFKPVSRQQAERNGRGQAHAIARFAVGSNRSPVAKTGESGQGMPENCVRGLGRKLGDKADAATIEIEARIEQAPVEKGRTLHPTNEDLFGGRPGVPRGAMRTRRMRPRIHSAGGKIAERPQIPI
jgi:hypothetical protein